MKTCPFRYVTNGIPTCSVNSGLCDKRCLEKYQQLEPTTPTPTEQHTCVHCQREMTTGAIACPHCGFIDASEDITYEEVLEHDNK